VTAPWRVGHGVDVHRFSDDAGRVLRLAGVEIPEGPGLEGHSDADVLLHAVADALLGAAGLGDLGSRFGSADPAYAGADSAVFVRRAQEWAAAEGWRVGNVDTTVVAQRPRLAPYRERMASALAELLGVEPGAASVKATTTDGLGFLGRGQGICCLATVLLHREQGGGAADAVH